MCVRGGRVGRCVGVWGEGECGRRFAVCVGENGFGGMFGRVCGFLGGCLAGRSGGFVDGLVVCVFLCIFSDAVTYDLFACGDTCL